MTNFFDAFISYGRADSLAFATKLYTRLLEQNLNIWFDQKDIPFGVDYQREIDENGIEKSQNFLFIIAPHSVKSPYCRKEIDLAVKLNKRIIPLLHIKSDEFLNQTHPIIGKINWIWFQEGIDDFEKSFINLISVIQRQADYVEQHTRFLVKALEWERNQKQTSYLLIQDERKEAESWLKQEFKTEQPPCLPIELHCEFICESTKNANNLLTQVFLSHSERDRDLKEKVSKTLMRDGFTIWTPDADIKTGIDFQKTINQGIEEADNFVYIFSRNSLQSSSCKRQLEYAITLNKRLICLGIEALESSEIPPPLQRLPSINFTAHQNESLYYTSAAQLLKELHQDERYYEEHKILLVKALKWKRQSHNRSLLLRGHNLRHYENWLKINQQRNEHPPLQLHKEFIETSSNQPPESSLEVFVSYSRADSDFARKLNEELQTYGKTTWFDQKSIPPGSDFQQEIYQGIANSDNFLFIISPKSVNSPYCKDEVEYAQKLNKRFVPILYTKVSENLHPALASIQWIDFNKHGGDFSANFSELVRTLDTDREHVKSHTKWLQKAAEWEQRDKSDDLLLRGSNLEEAEQWLNQTPNKQPLPTLLQHEYISECRKAETARQIREQNLVEGQINALSRFSLLLNDTDQKFDALIEAIRAGRQLQNQLNPVNPETRSRVLTALQAALYGRGFRERNRLAGHTGAVTSIVWSPDGKTIASASEDKTIKLWSVEGKQLATLTGHTGAVTSVSFSPDGKAVSETMPGGVIASASQDNTVKLWNVEGKLLHTLTGHTDGVTSVSFSPDGKTIASASIDGTVRLWSVEGNQLSMLTGHTGAVMNVSFSPDGKTIASASFHGNVRLWSVEGQQRSTLAGHTDAIASIGWSPNGQTITTASLDKTVKLWSLEGKQLQTLTGHTDGVTSVVWSSNGQTIATASQDKTVKLWSLEGKLLQTLTGHTDWVNSISFSPNGKVLASASQDNTIKLWSVEGKQLFALIGHTDWVISVSFSADGKTIASASSDNTVKLWSVKGELLHTLIGHSDWVNSVSFSPDSQTVASASTDYTVKLWSIRGKQLHTLQGHSDGVTSVVWSPDGQTLGSASFDGTVRLWSAEGKLLHILTGHTDGVRSVRFSPDSQMIASGSLDKTIKLWSVEGKPLHSLTGHTDGVTSVAWSPDGKTIASVSRDKTVKLWSVEGEQLHTLTGHTSVVTSVAWSPDGKTIASASDDKTVKLWSVEGKLLHTLVGHTDWVNGVTWSPDGQTIASASSDKTVIVWHLADLQLELNRLMVSACDWVWDYLKNNSEVEPSDRALCDGN